MRMVLTQPRHAVLLASHWLVAVVNSCAPGSSIAYADERGPASISADEVGSIVKELESEHTSCPCSATKRANLTNAFQALRKAAIKTPALRAQAKMLDPAATACETACFKLVSEDACGNENGPDAAKACSATCNAIGLCSGEFLCSCDPALLMQMNVVQQVSLQMKWAALWRNLSLNTLAAPAVQQRELQSYQCLPGPAKGRNQDSSTESSSKDAWTQLQQLVRQPSSSW